MDNWSWQDLSLVWLMWVVMMSGMMLPSAVPMLQAFTAMGRRMVPVRPALHTLAFDRAATKRLAEHAC